MSTYDVMLRGSPFCDLTFSFSRRETLPPLGQEVFADDFAINPGGIFNISCTLTTLGLCVGLKALLGNDIFSRFIAERMEEAGIPLELTEWIDRPLPIITAGVSFPHDRIFISYAEDVPDELHPRIVLEDLDRYQPRVIFGYGELTPEFMAEARRRGVLLFVDTSWSPEHLRSQELKDAMPNFDVFCPNLPEAMEITGTAGAEDALAVLSQRCRCVVIKMGGQGCIACCDGERYAVPAIPVEARETTGAGDNFNAGFIYGYLQGYPFERCLQCANIAGGVSTQSLGGCAGQINPKVIERWLEYYR